MSHLKIRRFWTKKETLAFLAAYTQRRDEFDRSKNAIFVYEKILEDLLPKNVLNQPTTAHMLCCKMKSLVRAYKTACESQNRPGKPWSDFGYMDEMEDIFGRRPMDRNGENPVTVSVGAKRTQVIRLNNKFGQNKVKRTKLEQQPQSEEKSVITEEKLDNIEELSSNNEFNQNIQIKSEITFEDEKIHELSQIIDETSYESHPVEYNCEYNQNVVDPLQTVFIKEEPIEDQFYEDTPSEHLEKFNMEETLIEYVRNNTILYNASCKDLNIKQKRREAWKEISGKIGVPGDTCRDTWVRLRNSYTTARKRRKAKSKHFQKWRFEDQMSFLEPILKSKPNGNLDCSDLEDENNPTDANEKENNQIHSPGERKAKTALINEPYAKNDQVPLSVPIATALPNMCDEKKSPPNIQKSKKRRLESSMCEIVKIMQDNNRMQSQYLSNAPSLKQQNYANDETELFFLSLARNVKKLSRKEQARLKMEISNMVFQAEYRDIEKSKSSDPAHSTKIVPTFTMVEDSTDTTIYSLQMN